jgi:hypothetical protein
MQLSESEKRTAHWVNGGKFLHSWNMRKVRPRVQWRLNTPEHLHGLCSGFWTWPWEHWESLKSISTGATRPSELCKVSGAWVCRRLTWISPWSKCGHQGANKYELSSQWGREGGVDLRCEDSLCCMPSLLPGPVLPDNLRPLLPGHWICALGPWLINKHWLLVVYLLHFVKWGS